MTQQPQYLGKYLLLEHLDQGGMGSVWRARDPELQREVAIKLLHPEYQNDRDFGVRFRREAQLIAALRHPNIVQIHDFQVSYPPESPSPTAYMVMDYVEGQTLAKYIRQTSRKGLFPEPADLIYIFTKVALALDYAHKYYVIHRDIKPANILLDQRRSTGRPMGEPILTDFGIARQQGISAGTAAGGITGTPLYISPEQAMGRYDDKRSDLYSLGIILYEMTTGVVPFRGESAIAIVVQHVQNMPLPPALINPNIPAALSAVILKSIAKEPDARFNSAAELVLAAAEALQVPAPEGLRRPSLPATWSPILPDETQLQVSPLLMTQKSGQIEVLAPPSKKQDEIKTKKQDERETPTIIERTPHTFKPHEIFPPTISPTKRMPLVPSMLSISGSGLARRGLVLLLTLFVFLIGGGIGLIGYQYVTRSATKTGPVGQLTVTDLVGQSNQAAIQIDIPQLPALPAGMHYYAWVESVSIEDEPPHWLLPGKQGAYHTGKLTSPQLSMLVMMQSLFLITKEQDGQLPPVIPDLDLSARLYYASITVNGPHTYQILRCPTSVPAGTHNVCQG
ncbi:serine/threonine protein kinase [Tengunoibacter tsumagoiensis]|uniref:non-specific serine/threonine protein kinase n=1 Tax=Tengunoibacter tsumagoiensis TaxID=2014871 RepID=A0A401ZX20_9CHLR|nr:serine/threonine-protein kinase [Tengunoibacter tsumagoiensis]GCE11366.1 hypothetical protein KTT_12250 [Tengunoibacter tsumagoiensis]